MYATKRFNTQPPEGGWIEKFKMKLFFRCFNTQPPEGGWRLIPFFLRLRLGFNTQPPEGGWNADLANPYCGNVSTHSRLKAAGSDFYYGYMDKDVSTHSRLKAAGWSWCYARFWGSCFNTQPPEGGWDSQL